MTNNDELPKYLKDLSLSKCSGEGQHVILQEVKLHLFDQFEDHCETLNGLVLETRDQWLGEKSSKYTGKWKNKHKELFDDEIGMKVPHWNTIPYSSEAQYNLLFEDLIWANELKEA